MDTTRFEMIVRAKTPIVHTQESLGNAAVFARKKVRQPGGQFALTPYVSGNSMRHQLRSAAAYGTLHAAGILDDPQLSAGATRLLFNGGAVTGKGSASVVNLDQYRKLVALFPPLGLFGGCIDNGPREGKIHVDELDVICAEQARNLPQWVREWLEREGESLDTCRACVEEMQHVRMDAMLSDSTKQLLSAQAQADALAREQASSAAHESGDAVAKKESKSGMMPYTFERLAQGTLFIWGVEARTHSPLEFDAFCFSIACLLNNFRVGGKGNVGHGQLEFVAGARIAFAPTAGSPQNIGAELAPKTGELYKAHIAKRKEELIEWVRSNVNS